MTFNVVEAVATDQRAVASFDQVQELLASGAPRAIAVPGVWPIADLTAAIAEAQDADAAAAGSAVEKLWVALPVVDNGDVQTLGHTDGEDLWETLEALDEAGVQRILVAFVAGEGTSGAAAPAMGPIDMELLREISAATDADVAVAGKFTAPEQVAEVASYQVEGIDTMLLGWQGAPALPVDEAQTAADGAEQAADAAPFDGTEISAADEDL
ncbi:hypothetical protein H0194_01850 [Corynebacterium incognita]|uniref:Uncharacterized protein n=1 Tax=Corynebacterium incognita TaxID=2754725 RepID=A0A7G7CQF5_9CORY|nr:hypothetical protein [Corynebacterium incognita]QNE89821.1 hypothetical protein H0194_01850 [Corynebacterium incognita]